MGNVIEKPVCDVAKRLKASFESSDSPFETTCHEILHSYMTEEERSKILQEFSKPLTYEERISMILPFTKELNFSPASAESEKSESTANKLRETGNEFYKRKIYHEALRHYTQCIAMSPSKCNSLALAYANRSAVLKILGLLEQCVGDIQRSLNHDYPEHLRYKLLSRRAQCYQLLGLKDEAASSLSEAIDLLDKALVSDKEKQQLQRQLRAELEHATTRPPPACKTVLAPHPPDISHGVSKEIPALSSSLVLRFNQERGRHLVATRDIQPGDVLAVEQPYTAILLPSNRFTHCAHCFIRSHSLLPCPNCSWTMYCSKQCQISAWQSYHELECPAMRNIENLKLRTFVPAHLAVRTIAVTGLDTALTFHHNATAISQANSEAQRSRGFNSGGQFLSSNFSTIYHQFTEVKYATSFLLDRILLADCLVKILRFDKQPNALTIGGLILRLMCGLSVNAHEVYERYAAPCDNTVGDAVTGNAVYPALGLINHSCDQNVVRHYHGKTTVLRAIRTIRTGEEVLDTYGPHFVADIKSDRQKMLKLHQYFDCECEPCVNNWPTQEKLPWSLPMGQGRDKKILAKAMNKVSNAITKYIEEREISFNDLPHLCEYLALLDRLDRRLSQEYFVVQEIVKVSYAKKGNTYVCK